MWLERRFLEHLFCFCFPFFVRCQERLCRTSCMQKHDFPREPSRERLNSLKEHDRKSKLPSATETHIFDQICKSLFRNLYISRRVGHNISCQRLLMETFWDLVWSDDPFLEIVKTSSNRIAQISENLSGKECVPKIPPQENMLSCWHVSYLCFK